MRRKTIIASYPDAREYDYRGQLDNLTESTLTQVKKYDETTKTVITGLTSDSEERTTTLIRDEITSTVIKKVVNPYSIISDKRYRSPKYVPKIVATFFEWFDEVKRRTMPEWWDNIQRLYPAWKDWNIHDMVENCALGTRSYLDTAVTTPKPDEEYTKTCIESEFIGIDEYTSKTRYGIKDYPQGVLDWTTCETKTIKADTDRTLLNRFLRTVKQHAENCEGYRSTEKNYNSLLGTSVDTVAPVSVLFPGGNTSNPRIGDLQYHGEDTASHIPVTQYMQYGAEIKWYPYNNTVLHTVLKEVWESGMLKKSDGVKATKTRVFFDTQNPAVNPEEGDFTYHMAYRRGLEVCTIRQCTRQRPSQLQLGSLYEGSGNKTGAVYNIKNPSETLHRIVKNRKYGYLYCVCIGSDFSVYFSRGDGVELYVKALELSSAESEITHGVNYDPALHVGTVAMSTYTETRLTRHGDKQPRLRVSTAEYMALGTNNRFALSTAPHLVRDGVVKHTQYERVPNKKKYDYSTVKLAVSLHNLPPLLK